MEGRGRKLSALQASVIAVGCLGLVVGGAVLAVFVFGSVKLSSGTAVATSSKPLPPELVGTCKHALLASEDRRLVHAYYPLGEEMFDHGHHLRAAGRGSHVTARRVGEEVFLDCRLDVRRAEDGAERVVVVRVCATSHATDDVRLRYRARDCRLGTAGGDSATAEGELVVPVPTCADGSTPTELAFRLPPLADHASLRLEAIPRPGATEPVTLRRTRFDAEVVHAAEHAGVVRSSW